MRILVALVLMFGAGCTAVGGTGSVEATFLVDDCPPGTTRALDDYGFEADWLATDRYSGVLLVMVLEYRVRVEETDGLGIRLDVDRLIDAGSMRVDESIDRIVRTDPTQPLTLPIVAEDGFANASLSLFQTCPNFPTLHATSGTVEFTDLRLAVDAVDTGDNELIVGTVTATVARTDDTTIPAAIVSAEFDFEPPPRPTASFK